MASSRHPDCPWGCRQAIIVAIIRTAEEWLQRLKATETFIVERFGPKLFRDYERYLAFVVRAFRKGYCALAQISLRRLDD